MRTFTIGEVLNRLKDEFDDITISKIRFLESEGLINPDRTDSGYRKFADEDIERLRYVLRAQRDRYLPLKVIKEELDRLDAGLPVEVPAPEPPHGTADEARIVPADPAGDGSAATNGASSAGLLEADVADVALTLSELCDTTGLEPGQVHALRDHGLIKGESDFDDDDLTVARAARELIGLGLEPRHLRMYLQFADRELGLFEQLVSPLLRQRNPDSRRTAAEQLEDLIAHGGRLHRTLLARELRAILHS